MPNYANRVKDTSTTTGTGNLTLSGTAPTGFQSFNTAFGTNKSFEYTIELDAEWESGVGYLSASTTLVRSQPLAGSAAVPVSFSAGTKNVFAGLNAYGAIRTPGRAVAYAMARASYWP